MSDDVKRKNQFERSNKFVIDAFSNCLNVWESDRLEEYRNYLGRTFVWDKKSEEHQETHKTELRSIVFDILNAASSIEITPELAGMIYPVFDGNPTSEFYIFRLLEHKRLMHSFLLSLIDFAIKIKNLNIDNITEKDIADMKTSISEMQSQINKLNLDIKEKTVTIRQQAKIIMDDMNNDRWATVPQFYGIVDQEKEYIGTKATRETKIRKTKEKLQKTISMFKTNKEGKYYRIEDIVEAALSLGYVKSGYKGSIIDEMKYKDNSRTKTDLESKGFEITGDNE